VKRNCLWQLSATPGYGKLNKGFGGIIDAPFRQRRKAINNGDKTDSIASDIREERRDCREELSRTPF